MKFTLLFLFSLSSFALVDYSDSPSETSVSRPSNRPARSVKRVQAPRGKSSGGSGSSMISFDTGYSSIDYQFNDRNGKVDKLTLDGHIQTSYDFFIDFGIPFYSGKAFAEQEDTSYQKGNAYIDFGVNWLTYGNREKTFAFDTVVGVKLPTSTEFGSQRTEKKFGASFSRRFFNVGLGIGYDLFLPGSSDSELEQDIGNISDINVQFGWVVSNDIKFMIRASNITISKSNNDELSNILQNDIKYSYVQPQIILSMSPNVHFKMEAIFQTRRPHKDDVSQEARLWSLDGLYGNSIKTGFSFSI